MRGGRKENENKDMVKSGAKDKLRRVLQEDGAKNGNTELWVRVGLKSKMLSGCTCQGITHKRIRLKDKGNTYRCLHAGSSSAAPD
jgi:hypothetical protein